MYKALVADDESFILEGLRSIVPWSEYGVEITHEAVDGDEASAILRRERVDLLISDIRMPGKSGLDLLREIRERRDPTRVIVLSGYDDFSYVRDAAVLGIDNYLLKPIDREELAASVERAVSRLEADRSKRSLGDEGIHLLRGNLFFKLVTGKISTERFGEKWPVFAAISADIYIQVALFDHSANATGRLIEHLQAWSDRSRQDFLLVNIDDTVVLLLTDREAPDGPARRIQEVYASLDDQGLDLRIAAGTVERGVAGIVDSYWEALRLLRMADEPGIAWPGSRPGLLQQQVDSGEIDRYHRIRSLLRGYRFDELREYVDKGLEEVFGSGPGDIHTVLEIVFSLLHGLRRVVPRHRRRSLPPDAQLVSRLLPAPTAEETRRVCRELIAVGEELTPIESGVESHLVRLTLQSISEDLSTPMNLKTISAELGVNPNYLGQLFRTETGHSFTEYLTRARLEEAKKLLCESAGQIQEIAREVGFTDKGYFTRVFKDHEGVTPTEYRRMMLSTE